MKRVPAEGPLDARIALIGEGPGREEEREGRPFVGRAGRQLDRMIAGAGILRKDCFITNVAKTYPTSGDKDDFFFKGGAPTPEFFEGILELKQELESVRPNVAVPMGNYALWSLTGLMDILKRRGSILESSLIPNLKVIPTIHPAYYIHGHGAQSFKEPLGLWDFMRVKEESGSPEICLPSADFIVNPTKAQVDESVERLLGADHITADSEWYSPNDLAYIAFTDSPDWAICLEPDTLYELRAMQKLLASPVAKVWQNAAFDAVALDRIGLPVRAVRDDLMVAWNSAWADIREKRLSTITSVLTRWPFYKDDLEYVRARDDRGKVYCCMDAVSTDEAMWKMETQEFPYTKSRKGYEITMGAFDIFLDSSCRGIRVDRTRLRSLRENYERNAEEIQSRLSQAIGYDLNVRSPKQVVTLIYDQLGVIRKKRTSQQDVLLDIAASTESADVKAVVTAIVRARQSLKMVSSYLQDDIIDRDGRLRTNWNLAGTRSGRFSTTVPWWGGLALQTLPREKVRSILVADPGTVFVGWDYGQAEARVVAALTSDLELLEDMENGVDIHNKMTAMLPFGLTLEQVDALVKEKGKDNVPERYLSKTVRHAGNYVLGSTTLRLTVNREYLDTGVGITEGTSRTVLKAYRDLTPGLEIWWGQVKNIVRKEKRLRNVFGRSRQFTGWLDIAFTEAVSFEPQSTVADLTTTSITRIFNRIRSIDPDAFCIAHVHDSGVFQVSEDVKEEVMEIIKDEATKELIINRIPLTIPVDLKSGYDFDM